ncbi:hypothetical protein SESBI_08405 [Sesbania bispinosa]|nr:hypothetical protein SESBI_08405 [Sesbania bispinosa]
MEYQVMELSIMEIQMLFCNKSWQQKQRFKSKTNSYRSKIKLFKPVWRKWTGSNRRMT